MRVYIPLTLPALAQAHRSGELAAGPVDAYAVTAGLREWYASDHVEELEYAALSHAAEASLRRLASDPAAVRRRVVVAVDIDTDTDTDTATDADTGADVEAPDGSDPAAYPGADQAAPGAVRIAGPVALSEAAAVHVDAEDAVPDVAAAATALAAADQGDAAARSAVEDAEAHELLWFATQEIPALLA